MGLRFMVWHGKRNALIFEIYYAPGVWSRLKLFSAMLEAFFGGVLRSEDSHGRRALQRSATFATCGAGRCREIIVRLYRSLGRNSCARITRLAPLFASLNRVGRVDTDNLHRYQLEDLLMRLGLATSGTRELLVRFKRWILHRCDCGHRGAVRIGVRRPSLTDRRSLYSGCSDANSPRPPLVQLRQFQGKGFTSLGASFASDSVYAIDSKAQLFLLRGRDNYTDTMEPASPPDGNGQAASVVGPAVGGGWLLADDGSPC